MVPLALTAWEDLNSPNTIQTIWEREERAGEQMESQKVCEVEPPAPIAYVFLSLFHYEKSSTQHRDKRRDKAVAAIIFPLSFLFGHF